METIRITVIFIALMSFLAALGFGVVSTTTSYWYIDESNKTAPAIVRRGLWIQCDYDGVCYDIEEDDVLRASRGFTILSLIASMGSLMVGLMAINEEGNRMKLLGALGFIVTGLLQLIGVGVYTDEIRDIAGFNSDNWGYSFDLAWAAVFLYGFSGLLYLIVAMLLRGDKGRVHYAHVRT